MSLSLMEMDWKSNLRYFILGFFVGFVYFFGLFWYLVGALIIFHIFWRINRKKAIKEEIKKEIATVEDNSHWRSFIVNLFFMITGSSISEFVVAPILF